MLVQFLHTTEQHNLLAAYRIFICWQNIDGCRNLLSMP